MSYGGVTLPTHLIRRLFDEVGDYIDQTAAL